MPTVSDVIWKLQRILSDPMDLVFTVCGYAYVIERKVWTGGALLFSHLRLEEGSDGKSPPLVGVAHQLLGATLDIDDLCHAVRAVHPKTERLIDEVLPRFGGETVR